MTIAEVLVKDHSYSNISISANANNSIQEDAQQIEGYAPVGIVGYSILGTNSSYITLSRCYISGGKVIIVYRNMFSSALSSVNIMVQVMYVKNK